MKKIMFYVTILSPVLLIVFYILGFSFYVGYIEGIGFNYSLFPLGDWNNALIWAYFACVCFFADISKIINANNLVFVISFIILFIGISLYFWWLPQQKKLKARLHFWLLSYKEHHPFVRFLFNKLGSKKTENTLLVVEKSNNFMLILLISLFIMFILIPIPFKVMTYGELIGIEDAKRLLKPESLCESPNKFWNQCISVSTSHLKEDNLPDKIEGRLIAKSETMLGIFTIDGPITMSIPEYIYYKPQRTNETTKDIPLEKVPAKRDKTIR
ncbi:membrane protein [Beggiatoa sp. PS]|nr:membrane protein [Beggiatoa sp. PS]